MGADLWMESIGFKAIGTHQIDLEWARSALAQATEAIARIDEHFLARINQEGNDYPNLADYRKTLLSDLKDVEQAVFDHHRHAAVLPAGNGIVLLVSGGLSWGDAPTELFESMFRLQEAEVFPDARWPKAAVSDTPLAPAG